MSVILKGYPETNPILVGLITTISVDKTFDKGIDWFLIEDDLLRKFATCLDSLNKNIEKSEEENYFYQKTLKKLIKDFCDLLAKNENYLFINNKNIYHSLNNIREQLKDFNNLDCSEIKNKIDFFLFEKDSLSNINEVKIKNALEILTKVKEYAKINEDLIDVFSKGKREEDFFFYLLNFVNLHLVFLKNKSLERYSQKDLGEKIDEVLLCMTEKIKKAIVYMESAQKSFFELIGNNNQEMDIHLQEILFGQVLLNKINKI